MTPISKPRPFKPIYLKYIVEIMHNSKDCNVASVQLARSLAGKLGIDESAATKIVNSAVREKLLVPCAKDGGKGDKFVTLPKLNDIARPSHDYYCFECHSPGALQTCSQCPRSFHPKCYRKVAIRPNYDLPTGIWQKHRLPDFCPDNNSSATGNEIAPRTSHSSLGVESLQVDDNSMATDYNESVEQQSAVETPADSNTTETKEKLQTLLHSKPDVLFVSATSPPRKRHTTIADVSGLLKSEESGEDLGESKLCTCCRLLKEADVAIDPDELCYLVNFSLKVHHSWIKQDIISHLKSLKVKPKKMAAIQQLLFQMPTISLSHVAQKVKNKQYTVPMEVLVDLLDFQHAIGIYFGANSEEFEATKWLVRDFTHDLLEIRHCADCFRFSHEKGLAWFAKPCVPQHELVFAKHSSSYWPAKVIRVLADQTYDVRFFGGTHARALIKAADILPIDTDYSTWDIWNKQSFRVAMKELHYYQMLCTYPASKFSFHASKEELEDILRKALDTEPPPISIGNKTPGRKRKSGRSESAIDETALDASGSAYGGPIGIITPTAKRQKRASVPSRSGTERHSLSKIQEANRMLQQKLEDTSKNAKALERANARLQKKLDKQAQAIKDHEAQIKYAKQNQWCFVCLKPAKLQCCFKCVYCSTDCQKSHWNLSHKNTCRNAKS